MHIREFVLHIPANTKHLYTVGPTYSTLVQHCRNVIPGTNVLCLLGYLIFEFDQALDPSICFRAVGLMSSSVSCLAYMIELYMGELDQWIYFLFRAISLI